ncbi:MAG: nucleoside hydrolase [Firmicutes bacterium]|nr:nucleoside hydrolase [Bacillota bacterium]
MQKIILDTDIGDDIDDALALNYILMQDVDIRGITIVFNNVEEKAKLTKYLLSRGNREDIPVYIGESQPLNGKTDADLPLNYSVKGVENYTVDTTVYAADFIIDEIIKNPGEITILAIGPLTNLAVAMQKRPDIIDKIKRIVIMGGAFYYHFSEWNIYCDPEAADIVFKSGVHIDAIGTDVTLKCRLSEKNIREMEKSDKKITQSVSEMIKKWRQCHNNKLPILHDPLAAAYALTAKYVEIEEICCSIETKGELTRGMTVNLNTLKRNKNDGHKIYVAKDVDVEGFITEFMEAVTK